MAAQLIDGKAISQQVKDEVKQSVQELQQQGIQPALAVILVGNNPASHTYVKHKNKACEQVGITSHIHNLAADATQADISRLISQLNTDPEITGILLQLPLPAHINPDDLLEQIRPEKDVDGFHPYNLGRLAQRRPRLRPCTPYGVIRLIAAMNYSCQGKHAVVVGASNIVGRPMALELLLAKATVTVCHRFTDDLPKYITQADILVSATGKYGLIKSEHIKPGAMVIDVGFSRLENGRITGDIDFPSACERAGYITPVPGGVGPMTVASLMHNTLLAAEWQIELQANPEKY